MIPRQTLTLETVMPKTSRSSSTAASSSRCCSTTQRIRSDERRISTADYVICIHSAGANESQGSYIGQIVNATSSEELLFP